MVTITHHVLGHYYSAVGVTYVVVSFFIKQISYLVAPDFREVRSPPVNTDREETACDCQMENKDLLALAQGITNFSVRCSNILQIQFFFPVSKSPESNSSGFYFCPTNNALHIPLLQYCAWGKCFQKVFFCVLFCVFLTGKIVVFSKWISWNSISTLESSLHHPRLRHLF